jgi:uncharacterized iron-regulated protein
LDRDVHRFKRHRTACEQTLPRCAVAGLTDRGAASPQSAQHEERGYWEPALQDSGQTRVFLDVRDRFFAHHGVFMSKQGCAWARNLLAAIALAVGATISLAASAPSTAANSPLVDKIWDVAGRRFVDPQQLSRALARSDFILLGEIHDNHEHHLHQAEMIASLIGAGRRPAIAFEQLDREFQPDLDRAIARGDTPDATADAAHFDRKGWRWEDYRPLIVLALDAHLPVIAANLSRNDARSVATHGFAALEPSHNDLAIATVWNKARNNATVDALVEGHCGQLSRQDVAPIALAQRARDAVLANSLLAHRGQGAVLITGAGHARRDLGVPLYLQARAPGARIVSVAFTEVRDNANAATDYDVAGAGSTHDRVYDYLWFTTGAERGDPCADFSPPRMTSAPRAATDATVADPPNGQPPKGTPAMTR